MELREIRRHQLRKLVTKYGTQVALAKALDSDLQSYFSRILGGKPGDKGGKNLGEKLARRIEAKLHLPYMYFDDPEAEPDSAAGGSLQEQLNQLPPHTRREFEKRFKDILELVWKPEARPSAEPDLDPDAMEEPWRLTGDRDTAAKRKRRKKK